MMLYTVSPLARKEKENWLRNNDISLARSQLAICLVFELFYFGIFLSLYRLFSVTVPSVMPFSLKASTRT